jgi:phage terminase large subunit GpA-like protein
MPDRLGDFLDNSVPARHHMVCPRCGESFHANTAKAAQLAIKYHRKFKCGKVSKLSIMENAQQLIAHGDQVAEGCVGVNTLAGDAVNAVTQRLEQVKDQIEETTSVAANLLGEGHSAVQTVTASAAVVSAKVDELLGQAQGLQQSITALDQLIIAHADSIRTAGNQAMGGGS